MENLTVKKADAVKHYSAASDETKEVLRELFGADAFKFDYNSIKTFEDACNQLGISHRIEFRYADEDTVIPAYCKDFAGMSVAMYQLLVICKAMNSDTGSYYDADGWGYYPVFVLYSKEEMAEMGEAKCKELGIHQLLAAAVAGNAESAGVRCAGTVGRGAYTSALSGFPLCLNSEEKAEYVGKQFFELCCACYGVTPKMD